MSYKKLNTKGFTIIEVLIVLAIAGLILLIVFLAVPALQRNARNTQRKTDAAGIMAAVNEYQDNNNGANPGAAVAGAGSVNLCAASPCVATESPATAKLGYYKPANVSVAAYTATPPAATDSVIVYTGAGCSGNTISNTGVSNSSVAALYGIESNGSFNWNCVQ